MHADMAMPVDRATRLGDIEWGVAPGKRQVRGRLAHRLLDAPPVDQVFEPGPPPVGAVAVRDKHSQDRVGGRDDLLGKEQHAGIAREALVAGQAAQQHAEIDARGDRLPRPDTNRGKADVVGVFQDREPAAAVEGDVELARQAVELAMV